MYNIFNKEMPILTQIIKKLNILEGWVIQNKIKHIILAGGESLRLKDYIDKPKQF